MKDEFESKWNLSDICREDLSIMFVLLKHGRSISLSCSKQLRGGNITPFEGKLKIDLCEFWDDDYELADTIRERGGHIDPQNDGDIEALREYLPYTDDGSPGYCLEETVNMPEGPIELQNAIDDVEGHMIQTSHAKWDEIVELYRR